MRHAAAIIALFVGCATISPVSAQVIEIDALGQAITYDGPTLFIGDSPVPVQVATAIGAHATDNALQAAAREQGLSSDLLAAVVWQESRGRADAISPKGAIGMMQLMPATARSIGVDPFDPVDNIRGGAAYLRQQIDRFGSVPLGLAAYNAGPGAVRRYGGIPPFRETQTYVSSILARFGGGISAPKPFLIEVATP